MVHRKNKLRTERYLIEKLDEKDIPILWDTIVDEIKGDKFVKSVVLHHLKEDTKKEYETDGVYRSIGETPVNNISKSLRIKLDEKGYIKTGKSQETNIPFVYAAGDITGGVNQGIVACSEGALAALSAYNDLMKLE